MKNTTRHNTLRRRQNMLLVHWKTAFATALCAAACSQLGMAQVAAPSILQIDIANHVLYLEDSDVSKFGTDPNVTTTVHVGNFQRGSAIADIVAVNGQRVMGTHTKPAAGALSRTAPGPGQAIADTVRNGVAEATFEILKIDGTPIGTIIAIGLAGGDAAPGSPSSVTGGNNFVITGGTGAFLGVRGQMGVAANPPGVAVKRGASMTEDPANRRLNGGGTQRWIAHLIPMSAPQIVTTASGPAVFHSDFSPVTAAKPAKAGEVLIVEATGLGPTVPGVDPGQPFPTDSLFQVNSPVDVTVNGRPAEVINNIGWPGLVDTYRIDFRVPDGTTAGMASIQITAAWIAGTAMRIAVQ
jgi:uncharacterized protein (TIGR03437 family)